MQRFPNQTGPTEAIHVGAVRSACAQGRSTRLRILFMLLIGASLLPGCTADAPAPAAGQAAAAPQEEATLVIGDTAVRATVLQTSLLGEMVAGKYGITRADNRVMVLVGLRRGESMQETSVRARITATVTDLRGQRQAIELRELHSGELVDYVGTLQVPLPDTLRFELDIALEDGARSTMRFTREFRAL